MNMNVDRLLSKRLRNFLTEDELKIFRALKSHDIFEDILNEAYRFKAPEFTQDLNLKRIKKQNLEKKYETKITRRLTHFYRVAAVFVACFGLYYIFAINGSNTISTEIGENKKITLPDASLVSLNAVSKIKFSKKDWNNKREVYLEGEAFFDVAKGSKFSVITSKGLVAVKGTEFNVKQRGDFFEVQCYEGFVEVTLDNSKTILGEGESIRSLDNLKTENKIMFSKPQWNENLTSFKSAPLTEVFKELERQFDIKIDISTLKNNPFFTGGFEHKSLENALIAVTEPFDLTFTIKDNNQVIVYD